MTHPITPPPELIKDWHDEWNESDQIEIGRAHV